MSRLEKLLAACGIDWNTVAERFGNDEELYLKCLGMFAADKNLAVLQEALGRGDYETAFRAAHTIKGMSANMGFDGVYAAACALVEPLRAKDNGADYEGLYAALSGQMRLIAELNTEAGENGK